MRWIHPCTTLAVFVIGAALPTLADEGGEREREISLDELPAAARATVLREAGDHEIVELEEVTRKDQVVYDAEWRIDGREIEITVTPSGEIVGRESGDEDDDIDGADESAENDENDEDDD